MTDKGVRIVGEPTRDLRLDGLTTLSLNFNPLRRVPDALWNLTGLECLRLEKTELAQLPPPQRRRQTMSEKRSHLGNEGPGGG